MSDELDHSGQAEPETGATPMPSLPTLSHGSVHVGPQSADGAIEVPRLPPPTSLTETASPPTPLAGGDAPYLPPPVRPAPPPVEAPVFDAKAMVDANKRRVDNPVYGHMPAGTPEGRAAAEAARAAMRRRRARNKWIGRAAGVVLLGGVAGAGYVGYRAYQDDQDKREAERLAAQEDTAVDPDDVVAPGPLGEQVAVIDGLDAVNSGATPSAGGLMSAVDAAKEVVGQTDTTIAPAVAAPDARSLTFAYRRYDGASYTSPFTEYFITYDLRDDGYNADLFVPGRQGKAIIGSDGRYRLAVYPDGTLERIPRTDLSLDLGPDTALATIVTQDMVIPPSMRPFLAPGQLDVPLGDDGQNLVYAIDIAGFAAADPAGHAAWVALWNGAGIDSPELVDASGRQVAVEFDGDTSALREAVPDPALDVSVDRPVPGAVVSYHITPQGFVDVVYLINVDDDFRAAYALVDWSDQNTRSVSAPDVTWVDAPL